MEPREKGFLHTKDIFMGRQKDTTDFFEHPVEFELYKVIKKWTILSTFSRN